MDESTLTQQDEAPPRPRGRTGLAWIVIIAFVAIAVVLPRLPQPDPEGAGTASDGGVMMEVQGKILVAGSAQASGSVRRFYIRQVEALNTGAIGQRQRAIVLLAEIGGPDVATEHLARLDELLCKTLPKSNETERSPDASCPAVSEEDRRVQQALRLLYGPSRPVGDGGPDQGVPATSGASDSRPRVALLDQDDRDLLAAELGWFGRLALAPQDGPDRAARRAFLRGPTTALIVVSLLMFGLLAAGLAGIAGLAALLALALTGRLAPALCHGGSHHGIYAETFALWLGLLLVSQLAAGAIGAYLLEHALLLVFFAFLASLSALIWPRLRGVEWARVRDDLGLRLRRPIRETAVGAGGYAMALPLVGVGIVLALVLASIHAMLQQTLGEPAHPLSPEGVPAHPVFEFVADAGWWASVQLLLVAVVAAPIVEEIMFRGVLYRHLRDGGRRLGTGASIAVAAVISALIFAIIHPVPWFAYPVLMALAIGFALTREWRGSIVPSIVMHGIHNAIVVGIILTILRA